MSETLKAIILVSLGLIAGLLFGDTPAASISIDTRADHFLVYRGQEVTYTYEIQNTGTVPLNNVAILDADFGPVGTVSNEILPGEKYVKFLTVPMENSITNTGIVIAYPSDTNMFITASSHAICVVEDKDPTVTIGDYVWEDSNGNGLQDIVIPEYGIPDVKIDLCDVALNVIQSTVTDMNGKYIFKDLPVQRYVVRFHIPKGYAITKYGTGECPTADSNPDLDGYTTIINPEKTGKYEDTSIDCGLIKIIE